ncbi:MAG: histidine--tRNA ligase [Chloroflexi bacterium GWC2_73_18]|nr:MAG: histidine--tRNA ligase [Chloroflexi bacterium GWC2_73_18]
MPAFRAPRGTRDILPAEGPAWARLAAIAADLARRYGYAPIETPLFELTAIFERGLGEGTDVVEKELFRLETRGDEVSALRPENTAGIVRAYLEHGMQTWHQPVRLSTIGSMFRYDRPQAGRYRQFHQWDAEAIGDPGPAIDAELVELNARFYAEVGLTEVRARLNSIGDPACRPGYVAELTAFYRRREALIPEGDRRRVATNPLRLLDSKEEALVALNADAPRIVERLCATCAEHFAAVRVHLDALGIAYELEPRLVRGLDYYTRTAWEFYRAGAEGQQQALGGGGRYDGLAELLGGRPTPGIGFAIGLERVILALEAQESPHARPPSPGPAAVVVGADPDDTATRLRIATELRAAGLSVRADLGRRRLGRQLEGAAREGAHFAVIVGDELAAGNVLVRDLEAGTQRTVPLGGLARHIARGEAQHRHGVAAEE